MHYNLLFNGCSFTAGAELDGVEADVNYRDKHRFSHVVSEKTGLSYCNISKGGSSNSAILSRTVEWFEQGNTCDHVIIQWTARIRRDYINEQCEYYSIFPTSALRTVPNQYQRITRKRMDFWKHYQHIHSFIDDQYNQDMCMYWMEYFLKDKCSLFYLKLCVDNPTKIPEQYYEISAYHKYKSNKKIHFIAEDILDRSTDYCTHIPGTLILGTHPNELGHQKIADYIIKNDSYFK